MVPEPATTKPTDQSYGHRSLQTFRALAISCHCYFGGVAYAVIGRER